MAIRRYLAVFGWNGVVFKEEISPGFINGVVQLSSTHHTKLPVLPGWQCERVSLGFFKGRYVQLRAMSHTEKFSRKMKIVQELERMENVILTPHNAFNTYESVSRKAEQTVEQIHHYLKYQEFKWQID